MDVQMSERMARLEERMIRQEEIAQSRDANIQVAICCLPKGDALQDRQNTTRFNANKKNIQAILRRLLPEVTK